MDKFVTEQKAIEAIRRLHPEAEEARNAGILAGMDLPATLRCIFAESKVSELVTTERVRSGPAPLLRVSALIPKIVPPPKPNGADESWIWVKTSELSPGPLVLGV